MTRRKNDKGVSDHESIFGCAGRQGRGRQSAVKAMQPREDDNPALLTLNFLGGEPPSNPMWSPAAQLCARADSLQGTLYRQGLERE